MYEGRELKGKALRFPQDSGSTALCPHKSHWQASSFSDQGSEASTGYDEDCGNQCQFVSSVESEQRAGGLTQVSLSPVALNQYVPLANSTAALLQIPQLCTGNSNASPTRTVRKLM